MPEKDLKITKLGRQQRKILRPPSTHHVLESLGLTHWDFSNRKGQTLSKNSHQVHSSWELPRAEMGVDAVLCLAIMQGCEKKLNISGKS